MYIILALSLAQFGIALVNVINQIRTPVGPDLIPVSYTTYIHRRMSQNLVPTYILTILISNFFAFVDYGP